MASQVLILALPAALSFLTAIVDIIFGMGFGLTMTPFLFFMGFDLHQIVPALLLSSLLGNALSSYFHHKFENVDFSPTCRPFKISMVIGMLGLAGSSLGALAAIGVSEIYLGLYIGFVIVASGLTVVLSGKQRTSFSWSKIACLGLFGSFNKGVSGSGFGPVVTTGALLMGIDEKEAVSIQTFSELLVSLAGFLTYFLSGMRIDWTLTFALCLGVAFSSPVAALVVKRIDSKRLRALIAAVTIILGAATLVRSLT